MGNADVDHEFGALNTLLVVVILGLCILAAYLIKQNSFYYLPESAAAIFVGLIVGGLARLIYPSTEELDFLTFEPQLFFFLLLPPIIFEAGYSLRKRDFFNNFWTIGLYAVIGTIISTFIIGYLIYAIGLMGLVRIDTSSPMEALLFGSLISAVDPVATLSIMGNPELNCDPLLYSLVFGESVLNDAVAIVLFKTFMSFYDTNVDFSSDTIMSVMGQFTGISLGSLFIGVLIGLLCSYLCKHTEMRKYPEYEISILFLTAYGAYSFSESLELSGIMSLFFCGIVLSHYNSYNLSPNSQVTAHCTFKSLAGLCEFFVFLFIGMGIFTGRFKRWNILFSITCIVFCLVARLFNTFPLSTVANFGRNTKIPRKMQTVIWFAGLRGAISFALSMQMPGEHRDLYISTTLTIVIFTTVVCGGLTEPMLTKMGMKVVNRAPAYVPATSFEGGQMEHLPEPLAPAEQYDGNGNLVRQPMSRTNALFHKFDQEYMRPIFGGFCSDHEGKEDEDDVDIHDSIEMRHTSSSTASSTRSSSGVVENSKPSCIGDGVRKISAYMPPTHQDEI